VGDTVANRDCTTKGGEFGGGQVEEWRKENKKRRKGRSY
jgi:hypothetical protein